MNKPSLETDDVAFDELQKLNDDFHFRFCFVDIRKRWVKIVIIGFLLFIVQAIFSTYGVISVLYVKKTKFDIAFITFCRVLIASPLAVLMALYFEGKFSLYQYDVKTILFFIIFGCVSSAFNPIMYLQVINFTSASFVTILSQLIPIFSSIISLFLKLEPLPYIKNKATIVRFAGIVIAVTCACIVIGLDFKTSNNNNWNSWISGTFLGIFNNLVFSLYLVLQTKLFHANETSPLRNKSFTINALCFIYGAATYIPIAMGYFVGIGFKIELKPLILLPIFYAGLLTATIGFGLLTYCIKNSSAIISSCLFSLQVATSLILLNIFAGESMTTLQYVICGGVVVGVIMVILSPLLKQSDT